MSPSTSLVVPGNWASVKGGKWHLLPGTWVEPEGLLGPMTSLCGVRFTPLNVTGGEAPPTNDHYICSKCAKSLDKGDFILRGAGSLVLVEPLNDEARKHLEENVSPEAQWWAGSLVVEPRYVADLVRGLESEGYTVRASV